MAKEIADLTTLHGIGVSLKGNVITKPLRLLIGIRKAADPGQEPRVVEDAPFGLAEAESFSQAERDQALPQHVFHRLTEPQIGPERQRGDQLGQAHARWAIEGVTHAAHLTSRGSDVSNIMARRGNCNRRLAQYSIRR